MGGLLLVIELENGESINTGLFFHEIARLSLTLLTLIPCHPSPLPHPPPPECFRLIRFTTALLLHSSSYIDCHCVSKRVRPFSADFSNVFAMTVLTFPTLIH